MLVAAICFAVSHPLELILVALARSGSPWSINPTGFITMATFGLIELVLFLPIGWAVAFLPSRMAAARIRVIRHPSRWYVLVAVLLGAAATPIAAAVPFLLSNDQDSPTYAARLLEFLAPMIVAGLAGGLSYQRCAAEIDASPEEVAKLF